MNEIGNSNVQQINANKWSKDEKEEPEDKDLMARELKQLKEITRYRFNLDKKLFEMKLKKKKIISKSPDHRDISFYLTNGMSFLPRTTFYTTEKSNNMAIIGNKTYQAFIESDMKLIPLREINPNKINEMKVHMINTEILRPYSRSLSPIIRNRERINVAEMNSFKRSNKKNRKIEKNL